jgi:hypothetical protein
VTYRKARLLFERQARRRFGSPTVTLGENHYELSEWLGLASTGQEALVRGQLPEYSEYTVQDLANALKRLQFFLTQYGFEETE